jgi:xanthine dehydrogenase accessory factor
MRELLAEGKRALSAGRPSVWCSVIETRGSTPQKAGAAMLVFPDGSQLGTLGGGCIEAEVKQRALGVLAGTGETPVRPELLTFCLDDDYGWDDGLICGGRMTILADPLLDPPAHDYLARLHDLVETGQGAIEAIALNGDHSPPGSRFLFDAQGQFVASRSGAPAPEEVSRHLPELSRRPAPGIHQGVAYLPILPRVTVWIIGGGHVGHAVGRLASEADFDLAVLDDRASYVSAERFPTAKQRLVGDIGRTLAEMAPLLRGSDYVLIVTRGHRHDEEALYHLAPTRAGYVGMIGSKRKIRLIYEDLQARGLAVETLNRVHAPLGFDIGSQTVPEIAISIVAELIACRNLGSTVARPRTRFRLGRVTEGEPCSQA